MTSVVLPLLGAAILGAWTRRRSATDPLDGVAERMLAEAEKTAAPLREIASLKELGSEARARAAARRVESPEAHAVVQRPRERPRVAPSAPVVAPRAKPGPPVAPAAKPPIATPTAVSPDRDAALAATAAQAAADADRVARSEVTPIRTAPPSSTTPAAAPAARAPRSLPPGYDPAAAGREARNVARHLYNAGGGYQRFKADVRAWADRARGQYARKVVAGWQRLAGLQPDGIYGPATHQALRYYGAPTPPPSLFRKRADGTFWNDSDPRAQYVPPEKRG